MRNEDKIVTSNAGTVTIPYAEYERFQAQGERISALEKQIGGAAAVPAEEVWRVLREKFRGCHGTTEPVV